MLSRAPLAIKKVLLLGRELNVFLRVTAYRLVDGPSYIVGGGVWDKVCRVLNVKPGEFLVWILDEE